MAEYEWCKIHDHNFDVNEGCKYCYNEHLKSKKVIDDTLTIIHNYALTNTQIVDKLAIYFEKLNEELNK